MSISSVFKGKKYSISSLLDLTRIEEINDNIKIEVIPTKREPDVYTPLNPNQSSSDKKTTIKKDIEYRKTPIKLNNDENQQCIPSEPFKSFQPGEEIDQFAYWLKNAHKVVFFLGAGMSVSSNIPTLRGKYGLFAIGKQIFKYLCCFILILLLLSIIIPLIPITFSIIAIGCCIAMCSPWIPIMGLICVGTPLGWEYIPCFNWISFKLFVYDIIEKSKPNEGHKFMKYLEDNYLNKEIITITQNIDALEEKAGVKGKIFQLHGNIYDFFCSKCLHKLENPFQNMKGLPFRIQKCPMCGKRKLRTGLLLFNEGVNPFNYGEEFYKSQVEVLHLKKNDLFVIIGTSGTVFPACKYPSMTKSRIVEININEESSFECLKKARNDEYLYIKGEQQKILNSVRDKLEKKVEILII